MATALGRGRAHTRRSSSNREQQSSNPYPNPKSSTPTVRSSAPSTPVAAGGTDRRRGKSSLAFATQASPQVLAPAVGGQACGNRPFFSSFASPGGANLINRKRCPALHMAVERGIARLTRIRTRLAACATSHWDTVPEISQEADVAKKGKAKSKSKGGAQSPTRPSVDEVSKKLREKAKAEKTSIAPQDVTKGGKRTPKAERDPRLPVSGSIIQKEHHGKKHQVLVEDVGFTYDGEHYPSLTAVAKKITGAPSINGFLFFGLTNAPKVATA